MLAGGLVIVLFLVLAGLMFFRKIPTLLALPLMAVGIAVVAGIPWTGEEGILADILQGGATRLAAAYTAVIFGAWLGQVMSQSGISKSTIRFAAELGGDRPLVICILLSVAIALLFTTIGGLGAIIMVGTIALPIMLSIGLPPVAVASIFLTSFGVGIVINLANWAFYSDITGVPLETVAPFAISLGAMTAAGLVLLIILEFKKAGIKKYWAKPELNMDVEKEMKVPKLAMLTPVVPLFFVLALDTPIIPAFIAGMFFAVVVIRKSFRESMNLITKSAFDGISDAAPPIILMIGIGMLLKTVFHPTVAGMMQPFLEAVIPTTVIGYILFFSLLAPLALYRGPLNMWGLGSGVVGLIIALGVLPATAALGAMLATERVQAMGDPTNTHNVWTASYVGTDVNEILKLLLPYIWIIAAAGVVLAATLYM